MKPNFLLASIALVVLVTTISCGTAPRATAVPTLAPQVITVVITATPPASADTLAPTVAATTTLTTAAAITTTTTTIAVARPTNTPTRSGPTPTRRPNTATPTKAGTAAPPTIPSIAKYQQAVLRLMSPIDEQRDVRNYGSDALVFEWQSIGALGTNECYLIRVDTKSNADQSVGGDTFLDCDASTKGTQAPTAQTAQFILNKPNTTPGPTYSGIMPPGGGDVTVSWSVTIVRDDGPGTKGDAYYWLDGSRHKFTLLSPRSDIVSFRVRGAPTP